MLILGIESSCDETAASVIEDHTTVRSNIVASQIAEHRLYGGVVPEIASRRHCENVLWVVQQPPSCSMVQVSSCCQICIVTPITSYPCCFKR